MVHELTFVFSGLAVGAGGRPSLLRQRLRPEGQSLQQPDVPATAVRPGTTGAGVYHYSALGGRVWFLFQPTGRPPLIRPPGVNAGPARHRPLVGQVFLEQTRFCMGKKKNRLTATKPNLPSVRLFYNPGSEYAPRRGEQNDTRHHVRRRRAKAGEPFEDVYRVAKGFHYPIGVVRPEHPGQKQGEGEGPGKQRRVVGRFY